MGKRGRVIVWGGFDDFQMPHMRWLHEASRLGSVHVFFLTDRAIEAQTGRPPKYPQAEREYLLDAVRFVSSTAPADDPEPEALADRVKALNPVAWVAAEGQEETAQRKLCERLGARFHAVARAQLETAPEEPPPGEPSSDAPKAIVTGCYDWLHSGHVRFFEEASRFGDLYVVVGHDANIRALKGEGHPLFPAKTRRYMVAGIRYVRQALISSGEGWLDAEPEIRRLRPDFYVVNEDGDRPEKRAYCEKHGIRYIVLKRTPKEGLPPRSSTRLRGY